jgi:hypothetical protein
MIVMLEIICRIPDHIGWALVGAAGMLLVGTVCQMAVRLVKENRKEEEEV